jgi:hypothetical protein
MGYNEKILAIEAADKLLAAVTRMAIDGWLSGEYNLPDQADLRTAALNYLERRYATP